MKLVVDASVAIKWYVPEEHSIQAISLLDRGLGLTAPDLIYAEVGNTLWKKARRADLSREDAAGIFSTFRKFSLEIHPSARLHAAAFELATALDLSYYDSLYLALAVDQDCAVVTADLRFHDSVKAGPLADHVRWIGEDR
jgi:predicted nucleic acid-binding protein